MPAHDLSIVLDQCSRVRIGVLGDYCLDAYWLLDEASPVLSIETGKPTQAVQRQRYALGGAGNILANLAALGVPHLHAFGVWGADLFAWQMRQLFEAHRVDVTGMIVQPEGWDTPTYAKPYLGQEELERLDFGRANQLKDRSVQALIERLGATLPSLDALILNQQLPRSLYHPALWDFLKAQAGRCPMLIDFRNVPEDLGNWYVKINAHEAGRFCGHEIPLQASPTAEQVEAFARKLHARSGKPVIITRGEKGLLVFDGARVLLVPGIRIDGEIDQVGAGDTIAAAVGAGLACGAPLEATARLANLAASVTVQKLRQTGSACPAEIMDMQRVANYLHHPELAADPALARYWADTQIEVIRPPSISWNALRLIIFDHDGTISTLREGWEAIMERMMVKAIMGPEATNVPAPTREQVRQRVRAFIGRSTGQQTLEQMRHLREMVQAYGLVAASAVHTAEAYKDQFLQLLMQEVTARRGRLSRGQYTVQDVTMKGVLAFLHFLREQGISLALLSGTDEEEVKKEAQLMGYASLFDAGISGARPNDPQSSKQAVMRHLLERHQLGPHQVLAFGDGPVEVREASRIGITAIGVASDEARRLGLNLAKRQRLIHAGADFIIPDFSEWKQLVEIFCGAFFHAP